MREGGLRRQRYNTRPNIFAQAELITGRVASSSSWEAPEVTDQPPEVEMGPVARWRGPVEYLGAPPPPSRCKARKGRPPTPRTSNAQGVPAGRGSPAECWDECWDGSGRESVTSYSATRPCGTSKLTSGGYPSSSFGAWGGTGVIKATEL